MRLVVDGAARRARVSVSRTQFAVAAVQSGLVTAAEAEAWVGAGTLPAIAVAAIDTIADADARAEARIRVAGGQVVARNDPFIALLAAALALTAADVDALFALAATK